MIIQIGLRAAVLLASGDVGRYTGVPYCKRVCRLCDSGRVEDQFHFLIYGMSQTLF